MINEPDGNVVGDLESKGDPFSNMCVQFRLSSAQAYENAGDLLVSVGVVVRLPRKESVYIRKKLIHKLIRQPYGKSDEQFVRLEPHLRPKWSPVVLYGFGYC